MNKSNEFKDNLKVENKEGKVVLSSVFKTKEQEKLFAKCAKEALSIKEGLNWDGEQEK